MMDGMVIKVDEISLQEDSGLYGQSTQVDVCL